jgi:hypothetical protein
MTNVHVGEALRGRDAAEHQEREDAPRAAAPVGAVPGRADAEDRSGQERQVGLARPSYSKASGAKPGIVRAAGRMATAAAKG